MQGLIVGQFVCVIPQIYGDFSGMVAGCLVGWGKQAKGSWMGGMVRGWVQLGEVDGMGWEEGEGVGRWGGIGRGWVFRWGGQDGMGREWVV